MNLTVTERAAVEVKRIAAEQNIDGPTYLRIRVTGGGCAGFETKLDLDFESTDKDDVIESSGIKVAVDKRSSLYLEGATVDFHEDINKRGFVVRNPNAKTTCGCNKSFSM